MTDDHRSHMELAVAEARKSVSEDEDPRPLVGVVVVKDGKLVGSAHRGETAPGDHAEFAALEKKYGKHSLVGATVYTTLEPCTTRNHPKVPCAHRLIEHRVSKVVIGMLDPNPNILGRGVLYLREAKIEVEFFPHDLMMEVEAMNREFRRAYRSSFAPVISDDLITHLQKRSIDEWYVELNKLYWNRNFQRDATAMLAHLVEVMGNLSVLVSKKQIKGAPVHKIIAKAIAWWFALCGKVGVKNVADLLWGKFPAVCPYCQQSPHAPDECAERKAASKGPVWSQLEGLTRDHADRRPRTLAEWQRMFGAIYPASSTDDVSKTFAKLMEEMGELAEAVRVFPAAPGYFLSEAADVFAWLMKISNLDDAGAAIPRKVRGDRLQEALARGYPGRCLDCSAAVCTCPPILATTVGRIAHEVPGERGSFAATGAFMTAEKASEMFGPEQKAP